jgi:hypothetical protein
LLNFRSRTRKHLERPVWPASTDLPTAIALDRRIIVAHYLHGHGIQAWRSSVGDLKFPGAQNFKSQADNFMFVVLLDTPFHQVFIIPDGVIHLRDGANSQNVTNTSSLFVVYADLLLRTGQYVLCTETSPVNPSPTRTLHTICMWACTVG